MKDARRSFKNIVLRNDTYEKLQRLGSMQDSFNDVILRLLENWEKRQRRPKKHA